MCAFLPQQIDLNAVISLSLNKCLLWVYAYTNTWRREIRIGRESILIFVRIFSTVREETDYFVGVIRVVSSAIWRGLENVSGWIVCHDVHPDSGSIHPNGYLASSVREVKLLVTLPCLNDSDLCRDCNRSNFNLNGADFTSEDCWMAEFFFP